MQRENMYLNYRYTDGSSAYDRVQTSIENVAENPDDIFFETIADYTAYDWSVYSSDFDNGQVKDVFINDIDGTSGH